ncbi:Gfo/Idh/MocA family protein [Muricoccus radiodurans]|uniref:Gfo/Idh/MocA family protein n=1 Tax=Muricoccus radiodurans TaxID=2231721 RepID=UPI003CE7DAF1
MKPLRVALAGAGSIAPQHLIAWARVPGVTVAAIADPDLPRARERARDFGIPAAFADVAAMLEATPDLDALDIAAPRELHAPLARLAAGRGLAVLCQKPLTPTLAESEALAADLAGTRLMVHENWRFRAPYRQLRRWLDEGRLGTPTALSIYHRHSGFLADAAGRVPAVERQPFTATEPRLMVAESLIHHLDAARWLMGPLELLGARLQRLSPHAAGETAATMLFSTPAGTPVLIEGHGACPGFPSRASDGVVLAGQRATARLDKGELTLIGAEEETHRFTAEVASQTGFDGCIAHFAERLRDGGPFETAPADNLETLRLVEAVYRHVGWPA